MPYNFLTFVKTNEFFKETNFRMPTNALNTPVQYAHGGRGEMHQEELLRRDHQAQGLASFMKVLYNGRPHWSDEKAGFYPVRRRLIEGADGSPDSVFMVDVGGSQGQDFVRLLNQVNPANIPGRLIVQDQSHVVNSAGTDMLPSKIERMAYDFFKAPTNPR